MDALEFARTLVEVLEDKKAEEILLLNLKDVAPFTDYFVICNGTSNRMIKALMDSAREEIRKEYKVKTKVEGEAEGGWLLADYGDVILHVFSPEQREFYNLEELWGEGQVMVHLH